MRKLRILDAYRIDPRGDDSCGAFEIRSKTSGMMLRILASSDGGWEHVSISLPNRCPNWPEMEQVRRLFFKDDECVMQIHAPIADYVDGVKQGHPYCLHLWRPTRETISLPPRVMLVGTADDMDKFIAEEEARGEIVR